MKISRATLALLAGASIIAPAGSRAAEGYGTVWQRGSNSVVVSQCSDAVDALGSCKSFIAHSGSHMIRLGEGYAATKVLWKARHKRPFAPDVILLGDFGGSGGNSDLIALTFARKPIVKTLSEDRLDGTRVREVHGRAIISIPFNVEFFNGMPHAGASLIPLPITYDGKDFVLDIQALTSSHYSKREWQKRKRQMALEFSEWMAASLPTSRLYPPMATTTRHGTVSTVETLGFLMLTGHADQARQLLHANWPHAPRPPHKRLGGEQEFWNGLCFSLANHPYWKRFHLGRIPQSTAILQAARS